jgi:hypothetical protein
VNRRRARCSTESRRSCRAGAPQGLFFSPGVPDGPGSQVVHLSVRESAMALPSGPNCAWSFRSLASRMTISVYCVCGNDLTG